MRHGGKSLAAMTVMSLLNCKGGGEVVRKQAEHECSVVQTQLRVTADDYHHRLEATGSDQASVFPSIHGTEARAVESTWLHQALSFCVAVHTLDEPERTRVSNTIDSACERYGLAQKLDDVSGAVDRMLAELTKLNALPLRD